MHDASALSPLFRELTPRVLGALVRRHRDLQRCEDAVQEALISAASSWPAAGVPSDPRAWLISVAQRRLIDEGRAVSAQRTREELVTALAGEVSPIEETHDDSLDLFFLCCQPALSPSSAVALTLRALGGLSCAEIARAYLVPEPTMAQRLSRARQQVKDSGLHAEALSDDERRARLPTVMQVLYLVFNEGYAATHGDTLTRVDLCAEAIRLARLLLRSLPHDAEVLGLLALMLLTDARREARSGPSGELIPLDEQDRAMWNPLAIAEGDALVQRAFSLDAPTGPYQLQAAIASLHDSAPSTERTDWAQIATLYDALLKFGDNPLVRLNQVIARAQVDGPEAGLHALSALEGDVRLREHHRFIAARAHLLERAGRSDEARREFARAAERTDNEPERNYLRLKATRH